MSQSVISVIGKDRIGIVYEVAKLLADNKINIINITQQILGEFFTMLILVDTSQCSQSPTELSNLFQKESQKLALQIHIQHEEIFNAMHRI